MSVDSLLKQISRLSEMDKNILIQRFAESLVIACLGEKCQTWLQIYGAMSDISLETGGKFISKVMKQQ